ncbi:MAG: hypothetical protein SLRJCFUN_002221 [Candidatus Fervidibacter sp.]
MTMPRKSPKVTDGKNHENRLKEIRQFLLKEPEEVDLSNDEFIQKLLSPFADFPIEVTRRWAEEWREEHRRGR